MKQTKKLFKLYSIALRGIVRRIPSRELLFSSPYFDSLDKYPLQNIIFLRRHMDYVVEIFVSDRSSNVIECFTPEDRPYGFSFGEWTTRWWEWALSVPMPTNPVLDNTGQYADRNQKDPVWFLAGTIGDKNKIAHRTCIIPKQKAILFPVINYICTPELRFKSDTELVNHVQKDIDDIVVNEALIDGHKVPIYRVKSDPHLFNLRVRESNKLDIPVGSSIASADGYWVFVKSLNSGQHDVYFHGACSGGIRNASAQYKITVK